MKIETVRHSLSHVLAAAVQQLFPGTKFGIGPAIENGFYYDFEFKKPVRPEDLRKIEDKMKEILENKVSFKKKLIAAKDAKRAFKGQTYKLELIKDLKEKKVSTYESNGFVDLCKGPHVKSGKDIPADAFRLTKIAGAYWKGNEKNKMLTRVYGLAFNTKKELDEYLKFQTEAEKRDHRVLGKKLDLFIFSDLVGKGLPLFTEKGSIIRRELEKFVVEEEIKRGYKHVYTPDLAKVDLYKISGHYPYYKDSMYPIMKIDEEELILRPMTCPHHYQIYLSQPRSYKELPFRIAELAKQFRYEKSGELSGLIRVRYFCLADAHIICQKEKALEEINKTLDLIEYASAALGFRKGTDFRYRLSLGDRKDKKKYYKDDKAWDFAEDILRSVLKKRNAPFFEVEKEAAFYGPKIDIQMKNFAGKEDTAFTVQYDFVAPKRFKLEYVDKDGLKKEPIVIHRSSIGAIERVLAFLLERHEGALPVWLSPSQAWVIPVGNEHRSYADLIKNKLIEAGIRAEAKIEAETVSKKIREGQIQKIPYLLVVGEKEIKSGSVSIRERKSDKVEVVKLEEFISKVKNEIRDKK